MLLVKAGLFVELFHLAFDDAVDNFFGLAGGLGLLAINFIFARENLRRDFLAADEARIGGGDVHGEIVAELLKFLGARDEIGFAIHFDDRGDLAAGVNVVADQAFAGLALGFFRRGGLAFFAQDVDGGFD